MINCVNKALPNEAFGLLLGPKPEEIPLDVPGEFQYRYYGKKFECVESNEKSPVAFFINNSERLLEIMGNTRIKHNMRVLSIFHSHPSGSYPSGIDKNHMIFLDDYSNVEYSGKIITKVFKNQIWTIIDSENKKINGYAYIQKEFIQIKIEINNS